eukprot:7200768-Prymnesium_polylepis.1
MNLLLGHRLSDRRRQACDESGVRLHLEAGDCERELAEVVERASGRVLRRHRVDAEFAELEASVGEHLRFVRARGQHAHVHALVLHLEVEVLAKGGDVRRGESTYSLWCFGLVASE